MIEFLEEKKCDICGELEYKTVYQWPANYYPHDIYETASWDGRQLIDIKIVKCKNCGVLYTNPAFKELYLNLVYPDDLVEKNNLDFNELLQDKKWADIIEYIKKYLPKTTSTIVDIGARYGILVKQLELIGYKNAVGVEFNKDR
jgi:hypothetical protein